MWRTWPTASFLYTYGFGVFILGSALCVLAPSLAALAGFRVLQALGAAMLQANSVAIIDLALPRASLGRELLHTRRRRRGPEIRHHADRQRRLQLA